MANKLKGEIDITLGGKKYVLRPTFEGLVELEEKAGAGLSQILYRFSNKDWSMKHVAAAIYGGLFHYGEKAPSFEEVGKAIVADGVTSFLAPSVRLLSKSISPDKDEEEVASEKKEEAEVAVESKE